MRGWGRSLAWTNKNLGASTQFAPNQVSSVIRRNVSHRLFMAIDVQIQVWMAATFALIVASYASRGDLTLPARVAVALLYLLAVTQRVEFA